MNWPFSKPVVKQNVVPRMVQKDFEKEEKKIQQFEEINKKLYKDVKRYIEAIDETNKSELKIINNLLNIMTTAPTTATAIQSPPANTTNDNNNNINLNSIQQQASLNTVSQTSLSSMPQISYNNRSSSVTITNNESNMNDTTATNNNISSNSGSMNSYNQINSLNNKLHLWKQTYLNQNQNYLEKLKSACQNDVIEPMKKLNSIFPNVYLAIKRREQAYNELNKQQIKLDKLQEKERTGANLVKINQQQQNVNIAKNLFQKEHLLLMEELPKLYDSRIKYIYPCVQQLIKSQIDFYNNYANNYDKLLNDYNLYLGDSDFNKKSIGINELTKTPSLSNSTSTSIPSSTTSSSRSISSISAAIHNNTNNINSDIDQQQTQLNQITSTNNELASMTIEQADDEIKKLLNEIKSLSIVASD